MPDLHLLQYFALYDHVENYRKKLDQYRYSHPEKFDKCAAKYRKGMEQLQTYYRFIFRNQESIAFTLTNQTKQSDNKEG